MHERARERRRERGEGREREIHTESYIHVYRQKQRQIENIERQKERVSGERHTNRQNERLIERDRHTYTCIETEIEKYI